MNFAAPPRTSRLAPYVASIGYHQSTLPPGRDRVLPGGGTGLMINLYEDEFRTYHGPEASVVRRAPGAVLTGAEERAVVIDSADQRCGLSVTFTPAGAAAFFGLPLGEVTGQLVGLAELWGRDGAGLRDRPGSRLGLTIRTCDEGEPMPPTSRHGKVCYLQIPAEDASVSARFYQAVFGWSVRQHGDGTPAFDDSIGEVSGMWVEGRTPWSGEPGLIVDIMVDDAEQAVAAIVAHGGEIVQPIGGDAPEITARFKDPAGNILGIYQEPPQ